MNDLSSFAPPKHVPATLVRDFPYIYGLVTKADPFNDLAAEVHNGPEIFYAPHAYPGMTPAWVIRKTEDLRAIYLDTDHFSNNHFSIYAGLIGESWNLNPAEADPPLHGLQRAFVNPIFAPKALAKLDDRIRSYAREYVEGFAAKGACEFMGDFALEFPVKVFMEMMGLPREDTSQLMAWEKVLVHASDLDQMAAATRSVVDYLRAAMADRLANPRDDLLTYGVQGKIGGREPTDDELIGFAFNLFIGGLDTISTHMGLQFLHLARRPDQQAFLRANPERTPDAVEELMRAYAAVTTFRTCKKETTFKGVTIMPGDKMTMSTTLAGRDPSEYPNPNLVDFDRRPKHVSFAYGPHLCVGMHLARREMRMAMEEFLKVIPEFSLPEGYQPEYYLGVIQPVELPLVWRPN